MPRSLLKLLLFNSHINYTWSAPYSNHEEVDEDDFEGTDEKAAAKEGDASGKEP